MYAHKQTRASHPDQHTQTPNTGQADRQTTELKAQPQTDQRSQVGQTAIKRHPPTPGPLGLRVSWPALALDPRTLGVRRQPHPRDRPRRRPHVATRPDRPPLPTHHYHHQPRLLLDGFFTDRKHKQTQANTGSTQTEHTHRHPRDHQRAREPRQARSQRPQEKGTRADRAPRTERHKDSQDSRPQPVTESTGQGTGPCPSISPTNQ